LTPFASNAKEITVELHGEKISLHEAPMLCCGFFASEPKSLLALERVQKIFERWSGMVFPAPIVVEKFDILNLLLASSLVCQTQKIAVHATRLARELFHLRSAHEVLQNNFAIAETLINENNLSRAQLRFENPPTSIGTGVARHELRQILPVSSSGLVAIDLHILNSAESTTHGIVVRLITVEDHHGRANWVVEAAQCHVGWVSLTLPVRMSGLAQTLELWISPADGLGTLPEFSLGSPQPLPRFRVAADQISLPGSLALRCWGGLRGGSIDKKASSASIL